MDVYLWCTAFLLILGHARSECQFPGVPAHCHVEFSEGPGEGSVASYYCERGFELLGPARRVCGPDGRWTPDGIPFCVLNVAAGKAPMQISTEDGGAPQRALDGSTAAAFSDTCTLTKPERVPWWYVNLLEPYMVQLVRLDFGKPCCGANKPAVIVVRVGNNRPDLGTNPICNRFTGFIEEGQPLFLPCNPPMPGAFVSVHLEAAAPAQLSICEAFVYTDQALPIERCPAFRDQPPGSTATYNGKCYIFYDQQPSAFREALGFCRARGGSLVDESNPALQGFISWELWRRHRSDVSSQYWMGAVRDPQDPGNWKWVNGNDVTVSFWNAPGGSENCARFDGGKGWLWADTDCQAPLNYICQHKPKACGRPEQPPNSTMVADNFEVGSSVQYACDEGHLLVGPTVRTCLDTGFYDEFPPVCKRIECGYPAAIAHGSYELLNGTATYLSHVQYACEAGYEMAGRARLVCDIDERWNGPPPRCEVVQCEEPVSIANGRVSLSHNASVFGSVAEYECARGYQLTGARRLACLASGSWDKPAPHCTPEERPTTTSSTTTAAPATPAATPPAPPPTTPRLVLPGRPRLPPRPASPPTPFAAPDTTRPPPRLRPRPTTERPTTERPTTRHDRPSDRKTTLSDAQESPTSHVPHIIVASHPRENHIVGKGNNIRAEQPPRVNVPAAVDGARHEAAAGGARLNLGAVVALAAFGALVFLIAIVTTIVILVRSRKQHEGKRYRHHVSADCNTVASLESSSSESRSGLNRYYRQAWEELHEAAGAGGKPHRRHEREAPKDGSELVVSDVYPAPPAPRDKRRHHHHHHHRDSRRSDWNSPLRPHHIHRRSQF